ncbi:MAG: hypothetical protein ABIE74_07875 [Pseudomonadota bacterium]
MKINNATNIRIPKSAGEIKMLAKKRKATGNNKPSSRTSTTEDSFQMVNRIRLGSCNSRDYQM